MKKIIRLSALFLFATSLFVACGTKPSLKSGEESHSGTIHKENMTLKQIHAIVEHTCEENAWNITEFKADTLLAEKTDGANTKSVTIKFSKHSFNILPADSDLNDAIEEALKY